MTGETLTCRAPIIRLAAATFCALWLAAAPAAAQISKMDRERARIMLNVIKNDIRKHYYDPAFRGIDLDERFKQAEEKLQGATSLGHAFAIIGQTLIDFGDSHTRFIPPSTTTRVEYGWQMQMVGDTCYVVAIKPGSDAEAKGLKVGDIVHSVNGFAPVRETLWKIEYAFYTLRPQPGLRAIVQSPGQAPRQLDLMAKVRQEKFLYDLTRGDDIWHLIREAESEARLNRHRYYEFKEARVMIWKMPEFDLEDRGVDEMMSKVRKHDALILDLRRNPGGYVNTMTRLAGHFYDRPVDVFEYKERKKTEKITTRPPAEPFKGKLVVLVDSNSASAAEVFSRMIQLEKRGTVIGDRTSGSVMVSRFFGNQMGADRVILYGSSITVADLIMTDGKSLEHIGVTPDESLIPSQADLAAGRDPVLARAAHLVGLQLSPEKAAALFPIEWRK